MFLWSNTRELFQKAKRIIESSRTLQAVLVVALVGFIFFLVSSKNFSPLGENQSSGEKIAVIFDKRSRHVCKITPFSQTFKRGEMAEISISLTPSKEGNSYELALGSLPEGVTGAIANPKGNASRNVSASFQASSSAQEGSFNAVIVYYERNEQGERLPNFCQLNLIIDL